MTDSVEAPFHRSPAQFFFEIGFQASFAEATVRARNVPPFELTDAIIERAWQIAPEGHPDREEFEWYLEQADGVEEDGPWQGPPAAALERYYLIGTDPYGDGVWSDNPCPTNDGSDFGAVEYVRADLVPAPVGGGYGKWHPMLLELVNAVHRDRGEKTQAIGIDLSYQQALAVAVASPRSARGEYIVENGDGKFVASFSTRFLADFFVAEGSGCYRHRATSQIAPTQADGEA